jgi:hypothetical protein
LASGVDADVPVAVATELEDAVVILVVGTVVEVGVGVLLEADASAASSVLCHHTGTPSTLTKVSDANVLNETDPEDQSERPFLTGKWYPTTWPIVIVEEH